MVTKDVFLVGLRAHKLIIESNIFTKEGFTLRTSNSTGNDWTIDFGRNGVGPYRGVKFWK